MLTWQVSTILAARGVDGGLLYTLEGSATGGKGASSADTGGGEGVLSLLQYAARTANEKGLAEPGDEQRTQRAYDKLARLVPGLMGGRGRLDQPSAAASSEGK